MADENENNDDAQEAPKSGSPIKIIIIAVVATLIIGGGLVGGTMFFMGAFDDKPAAEQAEGDEAAEDGEEVAEEPAGPVQYHSMDPKFVISFKDQRSARFMQFSLQLMTRNNNVMGAIGAHMPAIRSSLLLLLSDTKYKEMTTREGKEKLLAAIVEDVNNTITKLSGDVDLGDGVLEAYFDSFVIQ